MEDSPNEREREGSGLEHTGREENQDQPEHSNKKERRKEGNRTTSNMGPRVVLRLMKTATI